MSPAAHLPLTIVADDLTGACDAGALFAARGPVPVTVCRARGGAGRGLASPPPDLPLQRRNRGGAQRRAPR